LIGAYEKKAPYIFLKNRIADTPGYVVHELFHVAGIDKSIVDSQQIFTSSCIYDLEEEIAFVLYSTGATCSNDGATTMWKVPIGTVIEIGVHFKEDKSLSQLGLDLSKFQKVEDQHLLAGSIM
jgi:hypothetical protein